MPNTYRLIQTVTVGSGGSASMAFTSIPQTYTDLKVLMSARGTRSEKQSNTRISFNSNTSNFTALYIEGSGTAVASSTSARFIGAVPAATATASTFGNLEIYVPNYTSANYKSYSTDAVTQNNGTDAYMYFVSGLWSDTSAITSITIDSSSSDNFAEYSTATLYGISNA
jgi:hypothetical protein